MRRELTGLGELVSAIGLSAKQGVDMVAAARHRAYNKALAEFARKAATGAILGAADGFQASDGFGNLVLGSVPRATLAGAFQEAVRPAGSFYQRIIATDTSRLSAAIVGEGQSLAIYNTNASSIILTPEKVAVGVVYDNEMLSDPAGIATIEHDFSIVAARGEDGAIIAATAPDSSFGFAATDDPLADMETLLGALGDLSGIGAPTLAASPKTLLHIATRRDAGGALFPECGLAGGFVLGCEIHACDALADGVIRAISGEAYMAKFGPLTINASANAAVQMATNPTQSAASGTGSTMSSMFQSGATAVSFTIAWAIARLRDSGSAELDGIMSEW
jgi:hypothetical protein